MVVALMILLILFLILVNIAGWVGAAIFGALLIVGMYAIPWWIGRQHK